MKRLKNAFFELYSRIDEKIKFPCLKNGEVGIQIGFDMSSPITSDLFEMSRRVRRNGLVLGIDPDELNHRLANDTISDKGCTNIKLIQKGTFHEKTTATFLFGKKSSWNQLGNIGIDETVEFSGVEKEVELNTLDNILHENSIDISKIGHVNITNNGAEYHTLLGFENGLNQAENMALTVVAGRYDASGTIDGEPDHVKITRYLESLGYGTKFRRIHQLFWWGFCVKLLINRTWVYNRKNYGIIFAWKGNKKPPFYQSFS